MKRQAKEAVREISPDGREARGDATRSALIDAVIESVARHGLEGTTISKLAEITGLSRGLISFHFDGKDKLLAAALARAILIYERSWDEKVDRPKMSALERLHAAIDHDIDFAADKPDVLALWWAAWGEARAKRIYRASSTSRDRRFVADLAGYFSEAGVAAVDAPNAAEVVNAYLLGFWLNHHIEESQTNTAVYRAAGHKLIEAYVKPSKNRRPGYATKGRKTTV